MRSEDLKGVDELEVFNRFLALSGLPIDPASVRKTLPPQPDILCELRGEGAVAFELTELCDPQLARSLNEGDDNADAFWTSDPSSRIFRQKLQAEYPVTCPLELLCYTDRRLITPDDVIVPTLRPIFQSRRSPFRRAWLLGETGVHVIASAV